MTSHNQGLSPNDKGRQYWYPCSVDGSHISCLRDVSGPVETRYLLLIDNSLMEIELGPRVLGSLTKV